MLEPQLIRQRMAVELHTEIPLHNFNQARFVMENFLIDLSKKIEMYILKGPETVMGKTGPSSSLIWEESNCNCHTWPALGFVTIDIYSCKPYLPSVVLDVVSTWFHPTEVECIPII